MITLYAFRESKGAYNCQTILKDSEGKTKAIFSNMLRQPKRGQKTITLNCWEFGLNWDNVPKGYVKVKDRV